MLPFCLALFFASGFAGLVYQVLWMRELGFLFGSDAQAAATALAAFFLGIASGSAVFGGVARRSRRPLRAYGWLEAGVTASALLYFGLLDAFHALYAPLYARFAAQPGAMVAAKLAISLAALLPPAFFMGGTLPLMSQFLVRRADEIGARASLLYATNTLGAAFGALAAPFLLVPALGVRGAYAVALATTAAVGAAAIAAGRGAIAPVPEPGRIPAAVAAPGIRALAVLSGFATIALEVLWTRMFAQVLQNSVYTFAAILATFLLALAAGAALARELARRTRPSAAVLATLLAAGAVLVASTPLATAAYTGGLEELGRGSGFGGYLLRAFAAIGLLVGAPALVLGVLFPYLLKLAESWGLTAGRTVGELAALNTLGGVAGSLVAGFVALEWLGAWRSVQAVALLYAAAGLAIALAQGVALRSGLAPVTALLAVALALDPGDLPRVFVESARGEQVVEVIEGASAAVAVVRGPGGLRIKHNNHYGLGGSGDRAQEARQSHLPLLLHPQPRSAFFLGLGTGITGGAALQHPLERLLVAELSAEVVTASRRHFGPWQSGLFSDARAEVVVEDGRNVLLGTRERFDVIVADLFLPWKAGVGSLYAREHYAAARERLRPGGIYAQWLLLIQLSKPEFGSVARTLVETFPRVTLWRGNARTTHPLVLLLAERDPAPLDPAAVSARIASVELADFDRARRGGEHATVPLNPEELLFHYLGNLSAARTLLEAHPVNSDDRPYVEYSAPVTQREKRTGEATAFRYRELLAFADALAEAAPPESDPYLSRVPAPRFELVRAGREFYRARVLRELGDAEGSRAAAERSEQAMARALGGGAR